MSVRRFQRELQEEGRPTLTVVGSLWRVVPDWTQSRTEKASWIAAPLGLGFLAVVAMQSAESLVASPSPRIKYQSHLQLHSLT